MDRLGLIYDIVSLLRNTAVVVIILSTLETSSRNDIKPPEKWHMANNWQCDGLLISLQGPEAVSLKTLKTLSLAWSNDGMGVSAPPYLHKDPRDTGWMNTQQITAAGGLWTKFPTFQLLLYE
ncbi:uncharacterized protein MCYG_03458 [Microsporum canis CBS 113480]|uniref:Uncharacterized protein n=1 Tax=Arthroderma otae (strain ATCC MYA-4605 / CBS 113480) TaxID=554155 RepID=C5FLR7_ARTOC|nr:uncharacterized protein MCYG_03458 [Microsporum canis CBS 113480]EEQ30639.1 predicted protein [Microsporum canis CBS 113480]